MQLRSYQEEAVAAVYQHLRERDDNPCVVIPTAGGKTPVMATICRDAISQWGGRVLILAHVKELLEQTVDKIHQVAPELWHQVGVYSAGLKSRDTDKPITVAGIQSVYKRACELEPANIVCVDEAHLIPESGEGMYRTFLAEARTMNPQLRVIGLTATPFRMKSGNICGPENILNHICYEVGVRELIRDGYLCPLVSKGGRKEVDTSGLHIRAGEFIAGEAEALMDQKELVASACAEILAYTRERKACLVFASGVQHARHIAEVLREDHKREVATVFGDTLPSIRDEVIADFKAGRIKYLVNVNVLTTGFDAPNIDCVALVRPTNSPGLYYQMVGRGFRLFPGKDDCLVLDFGGNVMRHGPVDQLLVPGSDQEGGGEAPAKKCPQCCRLVAAGFATCPECGFEFPERQKAKHDARASKAGILSGQVTTEEHEVIGVEYRVHSKRGAPPDHPKTLRVDYRVSWYQSFSEWVCLEHRGYAGSKARSWWEQRSNTPMPESAEEGVIYARNGALCDTLKITVRSVAGEKYDKVIGYELGPKPEWRDVEAEQATAEEPDYEEIPF